MHRWKHRATNETNTKYTAKNSCEMFFFDIFTSMSAKYELHCAPHLIFAGIYFVFFLSLALHLLHFEIRINNQTWTNWYSNKILCWDTREIACCFVYFCIQCDSMSFNTFENKSRKKACVFSMCIWADWNVQASEFAIFNCACCCSCACATASACNSDSDFASDCVCIF